MNQPTYHWPNPHDLYPDRGNKSYRLKRLRFRLRSWWNAAYIKQFEAFINQSPALAALLTQKPSYSYPVAHRFLDKRFSRAQRLQAVCDNLCFLPEKLAALGLPPLWVQPISFGEVIPDFELFLDLNQHQAMEGYWALELRYRPTGENVYLLTFGKVDDALLIAVIQGPKSEHSKELVKQLTKKCHGLRPAYLMVEAMKALTQALGYTKLFGIPQQHQNKSRLIQASRYVVDYDVIFAEAGGQLHHYWQLPTDFSRKEMESIPSNKRSMYRKRYAMLEQLASAMQNQLGKA